MLSIGSMVDRIDERRDKQKREVRRIAQRIMDDKCREAREKQRDARKAWLEVVAKVDAIGETPPIRKTPLLLALLSIGIAVATLRYFGVYDG